MVSLVIRMDFGKAVSACIKLAIYDIRLARMLTKEIIASTFLSKMSFIPCNRAFNFNREWSEVESL